MPSSWSNACLAADALSQPPTPNAPKTFLPHCAAWVINTTDSVWLPDRTDDQVREALHAFFYDGWESTSNGKFYKGMESLEGLVFATREAFPDLKIHITDVACVGNDIDGYKTMMPDILTGTHLGNSALFGPATGKHATWSGMALCYVQQVAGRWQYVAEWVVHDELTVAQQLGRVAELSSAVITKAQVHDCELNTPSWGWRPPDLVTQPMLSTADSLVESTSKKRLASGFTTPAAKQVVMSMDALISDHVDTYDWPAWRTAMAPFWAENFVYDSTVGTGVWVGLHDWFFGEHVLWNDAFSPCVSPCQTRALRTRNPRAAASSTLLLRAHSTRVMTTLASQGALYAAHLCWRGVDCDHNDLRDGHVARSVCRRRTQRASAQDTHLRLLSDEPVPRRRRAQDHDQLHDAGCGRCLPCLWAPRHPTGRGTARRWGVHASQF